MDAIILKIQILNIIQILGSRYENILESTTLFVDKGETVVLNCTRFCANGITWNGPDGSKAMSNETVLMTYSQGQLINPNLTLTNIAVYGNFTRGTCHLQIKNFSTANDGIYQCIYFLSSILNIRRYNVFSKRPPTNLKIVNASQNNLMYAKEGVRMELKCTVKTGIPAATLIWSKEGLTVSNGSSDTLLYQFTPTRFDHMQRITCYAFSDLLTSPLSQTINLDIQYKPHLTIIRSKNGSIIEGESVELCCFSNSNPPVHYIAWYQNNYEVFSWRQTGTTYFDGLNKDFCLPISTVYRNHTGIYMCFAENNIATSTSHIGITVLYAPDVKVTYTNSEQSITLDCIPDGEPKNYTFYDWEHRSEFNEHIRRIHGTPEGQLIIKNSQIRKATEDDGIYVCTVSNGIANLKGSFRQEGQIYIESSASPVFVADNTQVQIGQYGKIIKLTIIIYDKLYHSKVLIKKNGTTVRVKTRIDNITTHDIFYGANIRVFGMQYTFHLHLTSTSDFTSYMVEACNDVGCNHFYVQVQSASCPESPSNVSVKATGQIVTVSWIPGFNGGFVQEFVLEFGTDFNSNFTVIVPNKDTHEENMNHSLDNLIPNTAYFICIFSRNEIGDSNKSNLVTFVTSHVSQEESTPHTKLIAVPVFTTIALSLTIGIGIYLYIKQKGSSVENRLYQSAEFLYPETREGEAELDNPIASSSHDNQLYQMQMQTYSENDEKSLECALVQRVEEQAVEPLPKITEADMNYAEIVFDDQQLPCPVIIHGIDDKTIYSDIVVGAQLPNLLSTNDSSSESEDDFIYVEGIENYTERRKMNASQQ
ncbi:unnamed protein product [Mytilus coruscus]|uniref:HMCN n=1 Tax=Mytilus coruscus TaxID=42192 RepID=A0A6J8B8C5_MYTCO|nr:unnamed protein product [Mytilus coruscus]